MDARVSPGLTLTSRTPPLVSTLYRASFGSAAVLPSGKSKTVFRIRICWARSMLTATSPRPARRGATTLRRLSAATEALCAGRPIRPMRPRAFISRRTETLRATPLMEMTLRTALLVLALTISAALIPKDSTCRFATAQCITSAMRFPKRSIAIYAIVRMVWQLLSPNKSFLVEIPLFWHSLSLW